MSDETGPPGDRPWWGPHGPAAPETAGVPVTAPGAAAGGPGARSFAVPGHPGLGPWSGGGDTVPAVHTSPVLPGTVPGPAAGNGAPVAAAGPGPGWPGGPGTPARPPHGPGPGWAPALPPTVTHAAARVPPAGRRDRSRAVLIGLVTVAAVLLAGAGIAWSGVLTRGSTDVAAAPATGRQLATGPAGVAYPGSPTGPAPAGPSSGAEPGGLVTLDASAAGHPDSATVQDLLNRHFSAINDLDYDAWTGTVTARRASDQPSSTWLADYRSTVDSEVRVTSIETTSGSDAVVGLSFVSRQDPADAPADLPVSRICWTSEWPVSDLASGGRIGIPPPGTTGMREC